MTLGRLHRAIYSSMVVSYLAALAMAESPRHHALKYRTSLATQLATVVAVAVAANSDTPSAFKPVRSNLCLVP